MESLTDAPAATRLHYVPDDLTIWLDTDIGEQDGLCIGVGGDRVAALVDARKELQARLADLDRALAAEVAS